MNGSHTRLAFATLLGVSAACGPEHESGRTVHVYLPTAPPPGGDGGSSGGGFGGSGGTMIEMHDAPVVTDMSPLSSAYGSEIRITGTDLGSSARPDVTLTLDAQEEDEIVLTPTSTQVVSWSETQIRFRIPFPAMGEVVVGTPEGTTVAGEFTPTWVPGPAFESVADVTAFTALASGPGRMAAVLNTGPPRFVESDGEAWSTSPISTTGLLASTIRLYLDENDEHQAFALTNEGPPRIATLDPSADFASTSSGVETGVEYALAAGRQGAAVWYRRGSDWRHAAPAAGTWVEDPDDVFADSRVNNPHHTAGATSDGGFFVAWSQDTGTVLDDLGAIFTAGILPGTDMFTAAAKASANVDDYVTSFSFSERGSGLVGTYCGSDLDPLGVTGSEFLCWALLRAGTGATTTKTVRESEYLRYTWNGDIPGVAYCSQNLGLRVVSQLSAGRVAAAEFDQESGETVIWPCERIVVADVDAEGETLVVIERGGKLYSPRRQ